MNWLRNLFRPQINRSIVVVFLDIDVLSEEQIQQIKERMTPVFVEFSGTKARNFGLNIEKAVITK